MKDNFVYHEVQIYDTLEGISIHYGISMQILKKINNLSNDTIIHLTHIKIPITKNL